MKGKRIVNLDLFRAIAILFVVLFHTTQMFTGDKLNTNYYLWDKFGVGFSFVLSGFLIGGLFYKQVGKINLLHFWMMRFFRTYPPYLVALLLSFVAVYYSRNEHFDYGYLIFIQNFYQKIPYFKVSWSLCIEEHFYIVFPFIVIISENLLKNIILQLCFWILLCILPTVVRWRYGSVLQTDFGYYKTASYFRFEGIAMGCLLSFLVYRVKIKLNFSLVSIIATITFFFFMLIINVIFKMSLYAYTFGYLFLNCSILLLLSIFYFSKDYKIAKFQGVLKTASMAYSLYLTHALTINFMVIIAAKYKMRIFLIYPITLIAIYIIGFIFYKVVELPTLRFRNTYFNSNKLNAHKFYTRLFILKKNVA